MALRTPPSWLQNGSHPAENDRLTTQALWATSGIISSSSLAVSQSSPVGMTVSVASGWAAIIGTTQANMGAYVAYNDAATTLTVSPSDPTNPRIDLVCVTIQDAYYSGAFNDVIFQVVAGTPAGSPVAPALPANSLSLATISVAAAASSITNANITDTRTLVTTNLPIGDITGVTAGTGLTGGGTSGTVTVNYDTSYLPPLAYPLNTGINAQTGTTYTPVLGDATKLITLTNSSAIAVTIPLNSSVAFPTGTQITFAQYGTGQVTISGAGGVTIVSTGISASAPQTRAQYSTISVIKTATDSWLAVGDIL